MGLDQLPLQRDRNDVLQMAGYGPVRLRIDYRSVLSTDADGVTFKGYIDSIGGRVVKEVALRMHGVVQDPCGILRTEAEMHVHSWVKLGNVVSPVGYLLAHDKTGTPATLVLEIGTPFAVVLKLAGSVSQRQEEGTKAIARLTSQLLRFIVEGDLINVMHRGINTDNMYVRNANRLETAELAMGGFGRSEHGRIHADGRVTYRAGEHIWDQTSPRMASVMYGQMASQKMEREDIELDRQLVFYNELFSWSRVAFQALTGRSPPDILYGPSQEDYDQVPRKGKGEVFDAVRHMLEFALELLNAGGLDEVVDSTYVRNLHWYSSLPRVLAGKASP